MAWFSTLYYGMKYYASKKVLKFLDTVENDDNNRKIRFNRHEDAAWYRSGWFNQLTDALESFKAYGGELYTPVTVEIISLVCITLVLIKLTSKILSCLPLRFVIKTVMKMFFWIFKYIRDSIKSTVNYTVPK